VSLQSATAEEQRQRWWCRRLSLYDNWGTVPEGCSTVVNLLHVDIVRGLHMGLVTLVRGYRG
jgi:hypothetical protein